MQAGGQVFLQMQPSWRGEGKHETTLGEGGMGGRRKKRKIQLAER